MCFAKTAQQDVLVHGIRKALIGRLMTRPIGDARLAVSRPCMERAKYLHEPRVMWQLISLAASRSVNVINIESLFCFKPARLYNIAHGG